MYKAYVGDLPQQACTVRSLGMLMGLRFVLDSVLLLHTLGPGRHTDVNECGACCLHPRVSNLGRTPVKQNVVALTIVTLLERCQSCTSIAYSQTQTCPARFGLAADLGRLRRLDLLHQWVESGGLSTTGTWQSVWLLTPGFRIGRPSFSSTHSRRVCGPLLRYP